jgi:predicted nucleic acid-binding Zn ribbon protein
MRKPREPPERQPQRVSASLQEAARRAGLPGALELAAIHAHWEELVGPEIALHAWPVRLRDGVLTVSTDHPAWASELRLLAAQLVERFRSVAGTAVVSLSVQVSPRREPEW